MFYPIHVCVNLVFKCNCCVFLEKLLTLHFLGQIKTAWNNREAGDFQKTPSTKCRQSWKKMYGFEEYVILINLICHFLSLWIVGRVVSNKSCLFTVGFAYPRINQSGWSDAPHYFQPLSSTGFKSHLWCT